MSKRKAAVATTKPNIALAVGLKAKEIKKGFNIAITSLQAIAGHIPESHAKRYAQLVLEEFEKPGFLK